MTIWVRRWRTTQALHAFLDGGVSPGHLHVGPAATSLCGHLTVGRAQIVDTAKVGTKRCSRCEKYTELELFKSRTKEVE